MAFVVVTHLDPSHESMMAELLTKCSPMPFLQVEKSVQVEPNCVYVIPPNRLLKIQDGCLYTVALEEPRGLRYPIDVFLRSLALDLKEKAICVILSGTGSDGSLGLRVIKEEGGLVIAQEESSAQYSGMPACAAQTGLVDLVLPVDEIPAKLVDFDVTRLSLRHVEKEESCKDLTEQLPKIFRELERRTGHDFSSYKQSTVLRRIERRMAFQGLKSPEVYLKHLRKDTNEAKALLNDLLIGVTSFFRDPKAFTSLSKEVIEPLVAAKQTKETIRLWVAGCASGEEAYTLAMLLVEHVEQAGKDLPIQIFATDLDKVAIDTARSGIYSNTIAADLSPERLQRFFIERDGAYRVCPQLREMIIFATHNLIQDPPFFKLDIISCRNLLIYINPELQKKVLPMFCYALQPGGYLFLGLSESTGFSTDLFETLDKKWKIYKRREVIPAGRTYSPQVFPFLRRDERMQSDEKPPERIDIGTLADKALLRKHSPPCVVVNNKYEVVHFSTRTTKFLEAPVGEPTQNLLQLAREELRAPLRVLMHKVFLEKKALNSNGLKLVDKGVTTRVNLTVEPLFESQKACDYALVILDEVGVEPQLSVIQHDDPLSNNSEELVRELEIELNRTSENLRVTIEEAETANEELKASNEELMSMNEELQSTNEELETSKEEMSALNEELLSVNSEFQNKLVELEEANSDILNLFDCTDIATVFLDRQLRVKRFTPKVRDVFNLMSSDIGRPLHHLASKVEAPYLIEDAETALTTLKSSERVVSGGDNQWFLVRILPYRTTKDVIGGVVINFIDISERKQLELLSATNELRLEVLMELYKNPNDSLENINQLILQTCMTITGSLSGLIVLQQDESSSPSLTGCCLTPEGVRLLEDLSAHGQGLLAKVSTLSLPLFLDGDVEIAPLRGFLPAAIGSAERILIASPHEMEEGRVVVILANKAERYHSEDLRQVALLLSGLSTLLLRREAKQKIVQAMEIARQSDQAKSDFLSNVSHEIRTPLTGVIGWLALLASSAELDNEQKQNLDLAYSAALQLKAVLDSVLDFSKIEEQGLALDNIAFSLRSCLKKAKMLFGAIVAKKDLTFHLEVADNVPDAVLGDETRLLQVLSNLIHNALKFTEQGRIDVRVTAKATDSPDFNKTTVCFSISDTGIGIKAEEIERLFRSFSQADGSITRKYGGTGLGLVLCKKIVEAMGGKIWVESEKDNWSHFSFTIPFELVATAPISKTSLVINKSKPEDMPLRILLTKDDESISRLFEKILSAHGCEVLVARNGGLALEAYKKGTFDLVLMDLQMPEMDGFEATCKIRAYEVETGVHTPIIALTAHNKAYEEKRCLAAGMDACLSKLNHTENIYETIFPFVQKAVQPDS